MTCSIEKWSPESEIILQDCFVSPDWNMFWDNADNIELTTSLNGFIRNCIGFVIPSVKVCCFPNQKTWINTEVHAKLKNRATLHRAITDNPEAKAEDRNKYKKSCYDFRRVIKRAKVQYRNKLESYYTGSDACRMWQGLQSITD